MSPRSKDSLGNGWMHDAVKNVAMMQVVRDLGVPTDDPNPKTGATPLMVAAKGGWMEPVEWLLMDGADPDRKDRRGHTAYDYASLGILSETPKQKERARARFAEMVRRYARSR